MDLYFIVFSITFGMIGVGYIRYASKQKKGVALLCGFLLCCLPYVVTNLVLLIIVSVMCMVTPFYFRV
jgi:hypothetical protein